MLTLQVSAITSLTCSKIKAPRLLKTICILSSCSVVGFKSQLDSYIRNIVDLPCRPGFNNSLDGGECVHGGHYADDLMANGN